MSVPDKEDITVVLAGKSGAGKSYLLQNLVGMEHGKVSTKKVQMISTRREGRTIYLVDIPSGKFDPSYYECLQKFDLLVLCIPVDPGSKFHDGNPEIMRFLQDKYGKSVWTKCVVVFTRSNEALNSDNYIDYIEQVLVGFQKELKANGAHNVTSETIFKVSEHSGDHQIRAIPAGLNYQDQVLPGVDLHGQGWIDAIFNEVQRKCESSKGEIQQQQQQQQQQQTSWWCTIQ